ncbi:MAG: P1 family peptidase [Bacteroidetes bacterium]|nr:P1 family peptidase [Bacteroidota bacterium]
MITDVPGFQVGHYTDAVNITGCTVILCPPGTVGSCDVRGSSPGSRELALLAPDKQMQEVHAVLLSGGSAYGLGAANGVMKFLAERGIGYQTPWVTVPIVPSAIIFDLNIGSASVFPTPENAYDACLHAGRQVEQGSVGAGTGAVVGKWSGFDTAMKGGVGTASSRLGSLIVGALAVVNAVGDVIDEDGTTLAGAMKEGGFFDARGRLEHFVNDRLLTRNTNTTLVVVASNAKLSKVDTNRVAQRVHDGMARAIHPCHTTFDGDVAFALSSGEVLHPVDVVAEHAAAAAAEAIRNAVRHATELGGKRGLRP